MNIQNNKFTPEQYKALYEAQQLGVHFDCWLLAPGERIKTQVPLVDEPAMCIPHSLPLTKCCDSSEFRIGGTIPTLAIKVPNSTDYEFDERMQNIMMNNNEQLRNIIANHNNNN